MTNYTPYEVAAYKLWVLNRSAQLLGVREEFLDPPALMTGIQDQDPKAAEKLQRFFKAYDDWYHLSSQMIEDEAAGASRQNELYEKIHERDEARHALLSYFFDRR